MPSCNIPNWLSTIPESVETPAAVSPITVNPLLKQRLIQFFTPESSDIFKDIMMPRGNNSSKRKFAGDGAALLPSTRKRIETLQSGSGNSLPSQSLSSQNSRRISSRKQISLLERIDGGICVRGIGNLQEKTPALASFLDAMSKVSRGLGIIPSSWRDKLIEARSLHEGFNKLAMDEACIGDERDQPWHFPQPRDVLCIFECATECQDNLHGEATWSAEVHCEVLRLALRPPDEPQFSHLVNFMPCSTASLIPEYLDASSPFKKVDFCIYIEPTADTSHELLSRCPTESVQGIIRLVCGRLPDQVINHTSHLPLRERPIALSIETKKTGQDWEDVTLPISTWQAAHWSFLRRLMVPLAMERNDASTQGEGVPGQDTDSFQEDEEQLPEFIPGIIIQGHDWYLVIATREGEQIVLWTRLMFGTTSSVMGIYQIIHGLQVLRKWAQDTYWPSLRKSIVRMAEHIDSSPY